MQNQKELTIDDVSIAVAKWNVLFSEQTRGRQQLLFLAKEYHSRMLFNGVNQQVFFIVSGMVADTCKFFPKIADILTAVEKHIDDQAKLAENMRQQREYRFQIESHSSEHDLTDEEIAENLEKVRIITSMLAGEMSIELAVKKQQALTKGQSKFDGRLHVVNR